MNLRKEFQDKHGLSFLVHADAAWGGYFATMLRRTEDGPVETKHIGPAAGEASVSFTECEGISGVEKLVPAICLKKTSASSIRTTTPKFHASLNIRDRLGLRASEVTPSATAQRDIDVS